MDFSLFFLMLRSESTGGGVPDSFDRSILRRRPFREHFESGTALSGTPDQVPRGLDQYCDTTGHRRMLLLMALPGLETPTALRSMRLFVDDVCARVLGESWADMRGRGGWTSLTLPSPRRGAGDQPA